jgi:hypothetical protein
MCNDFQTMYISVLGFCEVKTWWFTEWRVSYCIHQSSSNMELRIREAHCHWSYFSNVFIRHTRGWKMRIISSRYKFIVKQKQQEHSPENYMKSTAKHVRWIPLWKNPSNSYVIDICLLFWIKIKLKNRVGINEPYKSLNKIHDQYGDF